MKVHNRAQVTAVAGGGVRRGRARRAGRARVGSERDAGAWPTRDRSGGSEEGDQGEFPHCPTCTNALLKRVAKDYCRKFGKFTVEN